ncbi:transposase [Sphaerisporangium sp. NPDC051011]|uniref:transposase n=1 Tax=Sphaerisporangium sp. NPDC051011 TaxID=3155792 RepID=UPI00340F7505
MYLACPVRFVFADAGFAGALVEWSRRIVRTVLHIVRKAPRQVGFAVIPRRWVVERSLAWLMAHRRLAHDYERHPAAAEAMIHWTAISGMARRITRGATAARQQATSQIDLLKHSPTDCFPIPDFNLRPRGQPVNRSLELHTIPYGYPPKL